MGVPGPKPTYKASPTSQLREKTVASEGGGETLGSVSTQITPVPLPRQNLPSKSGQEAADSLASETSTKTSSSDSGIEDGKNSPTCEEQEQEEKV